MGDKTSIEWTQATWNPVRGCSRITPGCGGPNHQGGCYAEKIAARFSGPGQPFEGFAERTAHGGRWTGKLALAENMLGLPLRWRKPRRIFVNSMSDLFHEALPDEAIDKVFAVMALCDGTRTNGLRHAFQVLTKRADRMQRYLSDPDTPFRVNAEIVYIVMNGYRPTRNGCDWSAQKWPLPNVWCGVSVEDQTRADERIPHLLNTPAAKRWISAEPLLGPLDLQYPAGVWPKGPPMCCDGRECGCRGQPIDPPLIYDINWIVAGGESGPGARPVHPDWIRSLRDQCAEAEAPFFFKQWGNWRPAIDGESYSTANGRAGQPPAFIVSHDGTVHCFQADHIERGKVMIRAGKKAAGALLDGREHREFPA